MTRRMWATWGFVLCSVACGDGSAAVSGERAQGGTPGMSDVDDSHGADPANSKPGSMQPDTGGPGAPGKQPGPLPDGTLPEGNGGELGNGSGASTSPGTADYPAAVLCGGAAHCGPGYDPKHPLDDATLDTLYTRGLAMWRKRGLHGSCAGCHTPDAIDLAWIGYSDEDLRRRTLPHHMNDESAAEDIVGLVHAVRQLYQIEDPLDPMTYRPFQPGHEVLEGDTAQDRDLAFMHYLSDDMALTWAHQTVDSPDKAKRAAEELFAIDLRRIRVGLPFDRWSEDAFHAGHGGYAEWIPGMASKPKDGKEAEWYAIVDAYLEDPSDRNLWAYYDAIGTLTDDEEGSDVVRDFPLAAEWMSLKWKSVQITGHMLRHRTLVYPDVLADKTGTIVDNRAVAIARSPAWHAGDLLRRNAATCIEPAPNANPGNDDCTTFPAFVNDTIEKSEAAREEQNEQFKKSWFWTGWEFDHALVTTDDNLQTISGDYLMSTHLQHYKIHHAFIVAKLSIAKAFAKNWFNAKGASLDGHGKWASIRPFLVFKHIERNRNAPGQGDARYAGHARMFANLVRIWIYMVHADLLATGEVFDREGVKAAIHFARTWLDETAAPALEPGVDHADLDAIIGEIDELADAAKELRTDFNNGHVQLN